MCERGIVCVREKDRVCEREDRVCEREIVCVRERFFLSVCLSVYLFLRHTIEEH